MTIITIRNGRGRLNFFIFFTIFVKKLMKARLITSEMKDKVLEVLVELPVGQLVGIADVQLIMNRTGLAFNELNAILDTFQQYGFIKHLNARTWYLELLVTTLAHQFFEYGGFSGELARLKNELKLLEQQLKELPLDKAQKATSTISNVLTIIAQLSNGIFNKL